ncbi:hypothetical protein [Salipiger abyssi]|uniref:hypothetical protein n=1 Tax=Salipiger abyssi TaxID=1250539 RepID=UPI001A8F4EE0|nr:hypothetical protein [Salipiger abyssi]MBN9886148.1 hypothetical protein [Salipiger abyssi]
MSDNNNELRADRHANQAASGVAEAENDGFPVSETGSIQTYGLSVGAALTGSMTQEQHLALIDMQAQAAWMVGQYGDIAAPDPGFAATPMGIAGWSTMDGADLRDAVAEASFGDLLFTGRRMAGLSSMKFEGDGSVRNLRNAAVSLGHFVELEITEDFEEDFLENAGENGIDLPVWRLPTEASFFDTDSAALGVNLDGPMMVTVVKGVPFVVGGDMAGNAFATLTSGAPYPLSATDRLLHGIDTGVDTQDMAYGGAPSLHTQAANSEAIQPDTGHMAMQTLGIFEDEASDSFQFRSVEERAPMAGIPTSADLPEPVTTGNPLDGHALAHTPYHADDAAALETASLDLDHQAIAPDPGDLPV